MTRIIITGCNGRMGKAVAEAARQTGICQVVAGVDINPQPINYNFPVFQNIADYEGNADAVVDFSHHSAVEGLLRYSLNKSVPLVIATTGHTEEETALIRSMSAKFPVFMSANMSIGVSLLIELAQKAASLLGEGYDIEIIEKHHNQKLDAPSGTALMIAEAVSSCAKGSPEYIYDRHSVRKKRSPGEIGIHTVRGGSIIGEHEVLFAGRDEVITLAHSASTREVFAYGALRAARFITTVPAGMYCMKDLINQN